MTTPSENEKRLRETRRLKADLLAKVSESVKHALKFYGRPLDADLEERGAGNEPSVMESLELEVLGKLGGEKHATLEALMASLHSQLEPVARETVRLFLEHGTVGVQPETVGATARVLEPTISFTPAGPPTLRVVVDDDVDPQQLAEIFAAMSSIYSSLSGGDKLVILEDTTPVPLPTAVNS